LLQKILKSDQSRVLVTTTKKDVDGDVFFFVCFKENQVMEVYHNESDIALRLVEVWYDITFAYYMSSDSDNVARRMDKRQKLLSTHDGGMVQKTIDEKLESLRTSLKNIKQLMGDRQFDDICRVSLKSNDDLYPGFGDVLSIVKSVLKNTEGYANLLTPEEIDGITLPMLFQQIYYRLCEFLLSGRTGMEALKLVITPTKISHAAYDICRQKFCRLVCDEIEIVQRGMIDTIRVVRKNRQKSDAVEEVATSNPTPQPKKIRFPNIEMFDENVDTQTSSSSITKSSETCR
jgi:hypothetical protein